MKKRYQVFVSSTYEDLREERASAIFSLLKLGCIPTGMELFPSANDEVWDVIKQTIDASDYYVLIIAGRYGSISSDGNKSWTEREYDYAQEIGKPTFVFLYKKLDDIKSKDIDNKEKVLAFREKTRNRIVPICNNIGHLQSEITTALSNAIANIPGIGWVRADKACSQQPNDEKEKMVYMQIAEKFINDVDYDNWNKWTSYLTSADGPSITTKRECYLNDVVTYIKYRAIWPKAFPEIKRAFVNFANVLEDLLKQFHKYSKTQYGDINIYVTRKFYKELDYNPNYEEDIKKYNNHLEIMSGLTFELTKAVNYICAQIRSDLDASFKAVDGKRTITNGMESGFKFYDYLPEYTEEQIKNATLYPGLEQFLKDNNL
ncbi:DUF4062 domain-containing protein [Cloacibacillus evryensis]|uniref:DUF4062 domain-containing protein n=1 Tax=Cloacibacillus evryensis TaxID=508460 RepID=A0AAW5K0R0_9BACT|nr:DUF4062 domain-containing protein [Cloacibacillus evryensis]EHL68426.1 hypothetical protein HMPREF1006_02449 [Synergistes sp. 3_1_syn1]MCQ4814211.1 DUF4062 domain-containing protein [Cloacibacillus evryensis]